MTNQKIKLNIFLLILSNLKKTQLVVLLCYYFKCLLVISKSIKTSILIKGQFSFSIYGLSFLSPSTAVPWRYYRSGTRERTSGKEFVALQLWKTDQIFIKKQGGGWRKGKGVPKEKQRGRRRAENEGRKRAETKKKKREEIIIIKKERMKSRKLCFLTLFRPFLLSFDTVLQCCQVPHLC